MVSYWSMLAPCWSWWPPLELAISWPSSWTLQLWPFSGANHAPNSWPMGACIGCTCIGTPMVSTAIPSWCIALSGMPLRRSLWPSWLGPPSWFSWPSSWQCPSGPSLSSWCCWPSWTSWPSCSSWSWSWPWLAQLGSCSGLGHTWTPWSYGCKATWLESARKQTWWAKMAFENSHKMAFVKLLEGWPKWLLFLQLSSAFFCSHGL